MSLSDPIGDMIARVKNAQARNHKKVALPSSNFKTKIADILKNVGFIKDFKIYNEGSFKYLLLFLKYKGKSRQPVITTLERISKPGLRVYSGSKNLPQVLGNLGIAIVSTSRGVMTNLKAKELGIGGEILCYIW